MPTPKHRKEIGAPRTPARQMHIRRLVVTLLLAIGSALSTTTASAKPIVFWASDPVGPNETALIIGEDFEPPVTVTARQIPETGQGRRGNEAQLEVLEASSQSLAVVIPKKFVPGLYVLRIQTRDGTADVTLNRPAVYWTQLDGGKTASPNGWIRVFGRNLQWPKMRARLRLSPLAQGREFTLLSDGGGQIDTTFRVPSDALQGDYAAAFSNSKGADKGWRTLGTITLRARVKPAPKTFEARDFGATGNGHQDDAKAIQAALDAAGAHPGGGRVRLARGRYRLAAPLVIGEHVSLEGAGRNLTALMFEDFPNPPNALISGRRNFAIRDLTLFATNHRRVIEAEIKPNDGRTAGGVTIERIRVRANRYMGNANKPEEIAKKYAADYRRFDSDVIRIGGANNRITDNDLYGSNRSIFLFKGRDTVIARNILHHGRVGSYSLTGSDRVIFEDNEIVGADLMATGGGINNLYGTMSSRNVFFARNTFRLLHGWDREAMTTDGSGSVYSGTVQFLGKRRYRLIAPLDAKFRKKSKDWHGAAMFILGGHGRGQHAQVKRLAGDEVEIENAFLVAPDATSTVVITMLQENYILIGNKFSDTGSAIQFYGTSLNHIVSGNTVARSSGFLASGRWYRGLQPSWFCQFLDNRIIDANTYQGGPNSATFIGEGGITIEGLQKAPNVWPLNVGTIVRRNHLEANAHIRLHGGTTAGAPGVADTLIEANDIANADLGIEIGRGTARAILRNNTFHHVDRHIVRAR